MDSNGSLADINALNELVAYLQGEGYAQRTIQAYQKDVKSWLSWAESRQVPFHSLSQENVRAHIEDLGVKTESSAKRRIAALIAFSQSNKSLDSVRPSFSFLEGIELLKPVRRTNLSRQELEYLVESIRGYEKPVRSEYLSFRVDRDVAFATLVHFGKLRVGQLLELEASDFSATKEGDKYKVIVRDSQLTIPGDYYEIERYPETRARYQSNVTGRSSKLFINKSGESLDPRSVRRNITGHFKSANLHVTGLDGLRAR